MQKTFQVLYSRAAVKKVVKNVVLFTTYRVADYPCIAKKDLTE